MQNESYVSSCPSANQLLALATYLAHTAECCFNFVISFLAVKLFSNRKNMF